MTARAAEGWRGTDVEVSWGIGDAPARGRGRAQGEGTMGMRIAGQRQGIGKQMCAICD